MRSFHRWRVVFSVALAFLLVVLTALSSALALDPQPEPPSEIQRINIVVDKLPLNGNAVMVQGRIMVPLRSIFEALGASVEWNKDEQSISAQKGDISIKLQISSDIAIKNGVQVKIDVPPSLINKQTMVPARFVSESLGATVNWDENTKTVSITSSGTEKSLLQQVSVDQIKIKNITSKVHGDFSQLVRVQKLSAATALQQMKQYLIKQPEVKKVNDLKGGNLFVEFQDGYQMIMLLGEDNLGGGTVLNSSITRDVTQNALQLQNPSPVTTQETPTVNVPTLIQNPKVIIDPNLIKSVFTPPANPNSSKALIFDCLGDDANVVSPKVQYQVESVLAAMGYTITEKLNNAASLAEAAAIDDGSFGVVLMRGHGGVVNNSFAFLVRPWYDNPPPMNSGYVGTIPASATSYANGPQTKYGYLITNQFASTYWTNKSFPGTLFFLESCHGTDPSGVYGLPTWTVNHGASAWVGWNESVSFNNGDNGTKVFFDKMYQRTSVKEAIDAVTNAGFQPPELVVIPSNKGGYKLAEWRNDPNEPSVPDGRDFQLLKIVASGMYLFSDITFYGSPNFDEFYFYVDTNRDNSADVLIKCHPNNFEIYQKTGTGTYNNKVFTGTSTIKGNIYSMAIPLDIASGGNDVSITPLLLYDPVSGERLPDLPVIK